MLVLAVLVKGWVVYLRRVLYVLLPLLPVHAKWFIGASYLCMRACDRWRCVVMSVRVRWRRSTAGDSLQGCAAALRSGGTMAGSGHGGAAYQQQQHGGNGAGGLSIQVMFFDQILSNARFVPARLCTQIGGFVELLGI